MALALVLARLPVAEALAMLDRRGVLVMLGRHALPVFCAGSVLAIGAQVARFMLEAGVALELVLVLGGLAIQLGLAATLAWMDRGRGRPAANTPAANTVPARATTARAATEGT